MNKQKPLQFFLLTMLEIVLHNHKQYLEKEQVYRK